MVNTYDIGDRPRLIAEFTDVDNTPQDPTTVTCKVKDPSGTTVVYTDALSDVVGTWYKDFTITLEGTYYYRFEGTGGIQAAGEAAFNVKESQFA